VHHDMFAPIVILNFLEKKIQKESPAKCHIVPVIVWPPTLHLGRTRVFQKETLRLLVESL